MIPEQALAIARLLSELGLDVWKSMTLEQKQYWIQKGITNDQEFVQFVKDAVRDILKVLGVKPPEPPA